MRTSRKRSNNWTRRFIYYSGACLSGPLQSFIIRHEPVCWQSTKSGHHTSAIFRGIGLFGDSCFLVWIFEEHPRLLRWQDSGVKAMISGLVSASAGFLLSSSFNGSGSNECQKPHSKYIDLVSEWRLDLLGKYPESIGELFPPLKEEATEVGMSYVLVLFFLSIVALAVVLLKRTSRLVEGDKITKLPWSRTRCSFTLGIVSIFSACYFIS